LLGPLPPGSVAVKLRVGGFPSAGLVGETVASVMVGTTLATVTVMVSVSDKKGATPPLSTQNRNKGAGRLSSQLAGAGIG